MSDRDAFEIRIVRQFRLGVAQSRVTAEYGKSVPQRVLHGMPVMRIAKRFDRRNMHARLLGNRCDAFGIAHGLVITFPAPITSVWFEGAWLRMALMGICFSYAVRSPRKNRLIILLSLPLVGLSSLPVGMMVPNKSGWFAPICNEHVAPCEKPAIAQSCACHAAGRLVLTQSTTSFVK